jgi:hypothetical protein
VSLLTKVQGAVPFLRRKPSLPREDMLTLRPQRNPAVTWEDIGLSDDPDAAAPGAVLTVPRRDDGWRNWLARRLGVPNDKKVELDEFGAQVWNLCDGAHTVEQLVKFTCDNYKLNRRQGEISVVAFMRMLAQRRLIGFATLGAAMKGKGAAHGSAKPGGNAGTKRTKRTGGARRRN